MSLWRNFRDINDENEWRIRKLKEIAQLKDEICKLKEENKRISYGNFTEDYLRNKNRREENEKLKQEIAKLKEDLKSRGTSWYLAIERDRTKRDRTIIELEQEKEELQKDYERVTKHKIKLKDTIKLLEREAEVREQNHYYNKRYDELFNPKKLKIRRYEALAWDGDGELKYTDHEVNYYGRCEACHRVYELSSTLRCINRKCCNQLLNPFDTS